MHGAEACFGFRAICDQAGALCVPFENETRIVPTRLWLFLDRTSQAAAKALHFTPCLANIVAETSDPGCYVDDDECEHGYFPALTIKRLIWRSASSESFCSPWSAMYCSTTRVARCRLASAWARNNRAKNEGFLVGAESQAPVVSTFAIGGSFFWSCP